MSQSRKKSLSVLASLKRNDERTAAARLKAARQRLDAQSERLESVRRYLDEYRGSAGDDIVRSRELRDRRGFLQQLETALDAQRLAVSEYQDAVESARVHWLASRLNRVAVDKLIDRREQLAEQRRRYAEQRQSDEHAARIGPAVRVPNG